MEVHSPKEVPTVRKYLSWGWLSWFVDTLGGRHDEWVGRDERSTGFYNVDPLHSKTTVVSTPKKTGVFT